MKGIESGRPTFYTSDNSGAKKLEQFKQELGVKVLSSSMTLGGLAQFIAHPKSYGDFAHVHRVFRSNHTPTPQEIADKLRAEREESKKQAQARKEGKPVEVPDRTEKVRDLRTDTCTQDMDIHITRKGDSYKVRVSGETTAFCSDGQPPTHKKFDETIELKGDATSVRADQLMSRMPPPNGVAVGLDALARVMRSHKDNRLIIISFPNISFDLDEAMKQLGFKVKGQRVAPKVDVAALLEANEGANAQEKDKVDLSWLQRLNEQHNGATGFDAHSGTTQYAALPSEVISITC